VAEGLQRLSVKSTKKVDGKAIDPEKPHISMHTTVVPLYSPVSMANIGHAWTYEDFQGLRQIYLIIYLSNASIT